MLELQIIKSVLCGVACARPLALVCVCKVKFKLFLQVLRCLSAGSARFSMLFRWRLRVLLGLFGGVCLGLFVFFASVHSSQSSSGHSSSSLPPRFFVARSSVHDAAGLGLYAGRLIRKNEDLGLYAGFIQTESEHGRLTAVLTRNAESYLENERILFAPSFLRSKMNFTVMEEKGKPINWARLLKTFESYRFAFLDEQMTMKFRSWMKFNASGEAMIEHKEENFMLFVNEPPVNDFVNRITGKRQRAVANVRARNVYNGAMYTASRRIKPGQGLMKSFVGSRFF